MRPQRTRAGFHGNLTFIGSTHRRGQHGQQLPRLCSNRAHAFIANETRRAVPCELLREQAIHCGGMCRKRSLGKTCTSGGLAASYTTRRVGQGPLARERVQKGASFFLKNTSKKVCKYSSKNYLHEGRNHKNADYVSPFAGGQQADNGRLPPTSHPRNAVTCGLHPSRPHLL